MRIKTIELADGREEITLVCEVCKVEARQEKPS
jgi:hypothetical protein